MNNMHVGLNVDIEYIKSIYVCKPRRSTDLGV